MYKPPFSSFKAPKADPMQPIAARGGPKPPPGQRVYEAPVIKRESQAPVQAPRVHLIDPRKVRENQSSTDRRKDLVNTQGITMSDQSHGDNLKFVQETEEAKLHEFWVFPEECTTVWMDKRTGLAYPNVCLIGINGVHYPLFPGNNRAPGFVYEALETARELQKRYKEKIAPPKTTRSVILSDPRSVATRDRANMMTNPKIFEDSMLGRPNHFDISRNVKAAQLIQQHRAQALKNK